MLKNRSREIAALVQILLYWSLPKVKTYKYTSFMAPLKMFQVEASSYHDYDL